MIRQTRLPEFEVTESLEESILNFYHALGWDGERNLNVRDVQVNETTWLELCEMFIQIDRERGGIVFMNYSPSKNDEVPDGKVWLLDNFF